MAKHFVNSISMSLLGIALKYDQVTCLPFGFFYVLYL